MGGNLAKKGSSILFKLVGVSFSCFLLSLTSLSFLINLEIALFFFQSYNPLALLVVLFFFSFFFLFYLFLNLLYKIVLKSIFSLIK